MTNRIPVKVRINTKRIQAKSQVKILKKVVNEKQGEPDQENGDEPIFEESVSRREQEQQTEDE